jgi:hypothetical protein
MNTYTCPKYLWEVLVEIAFELQKKDRFVAVYRDKFLAEIYHFCIAHNTTYYSSKILLLLWNVYVYVYLISVFWKPKNLFFENQEQLMCQIHISINKFPRL